VNLIQAIPQGVSAVYDHTSALLQLPVQLARGAISPEQSRLVGYKGMFDIYQEVRQGDALPGTPAGVGVLLFFTNITISLGILNLLPVPALDGGRIFFTLPELILRRRIPPEYENIINLISFAALLALLIYVNLQDFINPIQLPKP
jgi:membrane-associated protease RseP (regulator of RpoE activity)